MNMKKKIIATDFDGTIYIHGKISDEDRKAVAIWQKSGGLFGFVTGRGAEFPDTVRELGITPDFIIIFNGALILSRNGNVIYESRISEKVFSDIEKFFSDKDGVTFNAKAEDEELFYQHYSTCIDYRRALELSNEISALYPDEIHSVVNGPHINIGKIGTGKSESVFKVLEYFGLPDDSAAVIGDDYNDMDMIVNHRGWAVKSGRPEVVAAAEHSCSGIAELVSILLVE